MQLSKKEMVTAAFCAAAYAFLAVLILWGSLWSITVSCVGIGTFTNAVTALYFGRFAGRKSAVLAAAFALLVSTQVGSYRTAPLSVTRHRMQPFHSTGSRPSSSTGRGSSSRLRRAYDSFSK